MALAGTARWLGAFVVTSCVISVTELPARHAHAQMTTGVGSEELIHTWMGTGDQTLMVGDVTGDDLDDIVTCDTASGGSCIVSVNDGFGNYGPGVMWIWAVSVRKVVRLGDVDADGKDDLILFEQGTSADVFVSRSTGSGFLAPAKWHDWFAPAGEVPLVGDLDADGDADIVTAAPSTGAVYAAVSTRTSFSGTGWAWGSGLLASGDHVLLADVTGDGRADFVNVTGGSSARIEVAPASTASTFGSRQAWYALSGGRGSPLPLAADMNGDGADDILVFSGGALAVYASRTNGLVRQDWALSFPIAGHAFVTGRANTDDKHDVFRFTPVADSGDPNSLGDVYVRLSQRPRDFIPDDDVRAAFGMGGAMTNSPAIGTRPLVVALVRDPSFPAFAHQASYYEDYYFGPQNPSAPLVADGRNLAASFVRASAGRFTWSNEGVYPLVISNYEPQSFAARAKLVIKGLDAAGFDFDSYDANGDGKVRTDELTIVIIDTISEVEGGMRGGPACFTPTGNTKQVCESWLIHIGHRASFAGHAHELTHIAGFTPMDIYGIDGFYGASVMQIVSGVPDDLVSILPGPYERMRLGWLEPNVTTVDSPAAVVQLDPAQHLDYEVPFIVYDERKGTHDYLMVEYRQPTTAADAIYDYGVVGGAGVRVWAVTTSSSHNPVTVPSWNGNSGSNWVAVPIGLHLDASNALLDYGLGAPEAPLTPAAGVIPYPFSGYGANGSAIAVELQTFPTSATSGLPCVMHMRPGGGLPTSFVDSSWFDEVYPGWNLILGGQFGDPTTLTVVLQRMIGGRVVSETTLPILAYTPNQVIANVPSGTPAGSYRVRTRDPRLSPANRVTYGSYASITVL